MLHLEDGEGVLLELLGVDHRQLGVALYDVIDHLLLLPVPHHRLLLLVLLDVIEGGVDADGGAAALLGMRIFFLLLDQRPQHMGVNRYAAGEADGLGGRGGGDERVAENVGGGEAVLVRFKQLLETLVRDAPVRGHAQVCHACGDDGGHLVAEAGGVFGDLGLDARVGVDEDGEEDVEEDEEDDEEEGPEVEVERPLGRRVRHLDPELRRVERHQLEEEEDAADARVLHPLELVPEEQVPHHRIPEEHDEEQKRKVAQVRHRRRQSARHKPHPRLEVQVLEDADDEEHDADAGDGDVARERVGRGLDLVHEVQIILLVLRVGGKEAGLGGGVGEDGVGGFHFEPGDALSVERPHDPADPHHDEVHPVEDVHRIQEVGDGVHDADADEDVVELVEAVGRQEDHTHDLQDLLRLPLVAPVHVDEHSLELEVPVDAAAHLPGEG
mmetsp:Transcript_58898/g.120519  ORF Transcript_58898/g.120519 Transcript_58898/m.120519 type:complete len:441 (-) Transcript_58898:2424-3746(-)